MQVIGLPVPKHFKAHTRFARTNASCNKALDGKVCKVLFRCDAFDAVPDCRHGPFARFFRKRPTESIIEIDNGVFKIRPIKKDGFGFPVRLKGLVVVQVIAR